MTQKAECPKVPALVKCLSRGAIIEQAGEEGGQAWGVVKMASWGDKEGG